MRLVGVGAQVAGRAQVGALGAREPKLDGPVGPQRGQRAVGVVPRDREAQGEEPHEHRGGLGAVAGGQVGRKALLAVQGARSHRAKRVLDPVHRVCRSSQVGAQARQEFRVGHRRRAHGDKGMPPPAGSRYSAVTRRWWNTSNQLGVGLARRGQAGEMGRPSRELSRANASGLTQ